MVALRPTLLLTGVPARFEMRWLSRGDLCVLFFENQPEAGETPFRAVALYDPASATGSWQDSFGGRYDLSFEATDREVVVDVGLSGPEPAGFGRASYRRVGSG